MAVGYPSQRARPNAGRVVEYRDGDRVVYHPDPNDKYAYQHLRDKSGTVMFVDFETDWCYVKFDYQTQLGVLPCSPIELSMKEV